MIKAVLNKIKERAELACARFKKYNSAHRRQVVNSMVIAAAISADFMLTGMAGYNEIGEAYICVDGEVIAVFANGVTVSDMLEEEGIILGEYDEISCDASARPLPGEVITIDRVEYIEYTKSEPTEYDTVYIDDVNSAIGTKEITVFGRFGRIDTVVKEKLVNGETVQSYISETIVTEPVNEIVTVGTAASEPYSKRIGDYSLTNGVPDKFEYLLEGKVTAYTAPEGSGTYSGRPLEIGTVAVDPEKIPFGSELYICSKDGSRVYGYAVAADTGNLTDVIADVYMGVSSEHYYDACDWGAQDAYVYVLSVGDNSISWR